MQRFKKFWLLALAILLSIGVAGPLAAQVVKGSISGTVLDKTGATVPGAKVTAKNVATNEEYNTTTEENGLFKLSLLSVGVYNLQISKQGFSTMQLTNLSISAGVDTGLGSVTLQLGETSQTIEVSSKQPVIETTQAQISDTFTKDLMGSFPGIQENQGIDFLALQLPGVSNTRDDTFSNTNGVGFSVNGLRGRNNDQEIDGQNNNDNSIGGPQIFNTDTEFFQEAQITTNNFGPEFGRNSGSVINVVTKQGTNNWHGSVYGTENNSVLNTRSNTQIFFEGVKKLPRVNNEFTGATIGGPVWKNHVFLFGGFDDQIISSKTLNASGLLTPTPLGVAQLAACFPGSNTITALQTFGPYAVGGGNPKPQAITTTNVGACSNVQVGGIQRLLTSSSHIYDWIYRMDAVVSDADRFSGRYLFQKINPLNLFGGAAGYPVNVPSLGQSFAGSWTHTFNSRMVNEARLNFGRTNVQFGGNTLGTIPGIGQLDSTLTSIAFLDPTLLSFGPNPAFPEGRIVNTYQAQDNWNDVMGRHQLKAGVNFTYQRSENVFLPGINGQFIYANLLRFAQNRPVADLVANGDANLDFREYDTFFYVGDDFRVKSNLTLNLGLTWSYYGQPANLFHNMTTKRETGPNPLFNPALPLSIRTFPSLRAPKNSWGPSVGFAWTPGWSNWLLGNGKTVIRGGYRLSYDPPFYNIYLNVDESTPVTLTSVIVGPGVAPALPSKFTGNDVRPVLLAALPPGGDPRNFAQETLPHNFGPDRVHEWTLGVQREFSNRSALEIRYVGNHGTDLFQFVNGNPFVAKLQAEFPKLVPSGITPCPASQAFGPLAIGRVNCTQGILGILQNSAISDYEGAQVQFRTQSLWNQLTLLTSYTYSKTTDNSSEIFNTFAAGNTETLAQNSLDIHGAEHGLSGLDVPNNWTLAFNEELPFYRGQHGVVGHVLGGWSLSGNSIFGSGQPFTPAQFALNFGTSGGASPFDIAFNQNLNNQNPDVARPFIGSHGASDTQVGIFAGDACALFGAGCTDPVNTLLNLNAINSTGAVTAVSKNQVRFIVNGATADQIFGTPFGNAARNSLRDYQSVAFNFNVAKDIKFREKATLRWHMSMVNAFNHPSFGLPGPTGIDPFINDAGLANETVGFNNPRLFSGGGRTINFGLKVIF